MAWYALICGPAWLGIDGRFWLGLAIVIAVVCVMNGWWWTRSKNQ